MGAAASPGRSLTPAGRRGRWWTIAGGAVAALAGTVAAVRLLAPLPPLDGREDSRAVSPDGDTSLGRAIGPEVRAHPGLTGLHLLREPLDAFAARVLLARAAERTLDVQYYIWNADQSGLWLMAEVVRAADRGVRVRLLLDDNNTTGDDPLFAALASHPNIELRLFNPFTVRRFRPLAYLADFSRLNRRMHNKSLTADGVLTILGGRNVGDEYYGVRDEGSLMDLDVAAAGAAVADVQEQFDRYWASRSAYPADRILAPPPPDLLDRLRRGEPLDERRGPSGAYADAVGRSDFARAATSGDLELTWARARLLCDDPAKGLGQAPQEKRVWAELDGVLRSARSSLSLVSGYFVPARMGTDLLTSLARRGVDVRVLTNGFATTDVRIVHAGYVKRRDELLRAGVRLFELSSAERLEGEDKAKRSGNAGSRFSGAGQGLHAKIFSVDRRRLFIGSFNFDPRSAALNTEMGLLIESEDLARTLDEGLRERLPGATFEVKLDGDGGLRWTPVSDDGARPTGREPGMSASDRLATGFLSLLPIDWML